MSDMEDGLRAVIGLIMFFALLPFVLELLSITYGIPVFITTETIVKILRILIIGFIFFVFLSAIANAFD